MKLKYPEGATPIEDFSGLIPRHITNKKQLDEWETENILQAAAKYFGGKRTFKINTEFFRKIHRDMFAQTWKWAGEFRKNDFNIGINWHAIPVEMKKLCDDLVFWKEKRSFDIMEQSVRLHHRLVKIHPFVNGNGRHARFSADLFLHYHKQPLPEWPNDRLIKLTDIRKKYISALIKADNGDYSALLDFTKRLLPRS
jgi:Fic-DOC domain mobile mystery protein B